MHPLFSRYNNVEFVTLAACWTQSWGCVYGCCASAHWFSSHLCCYPTECCTFDWSTFYLLFL